jgi:uncharacterized protein
MIAVDTNVLVYSHVRIATHHAAALRCLRQLCEGSETWAIPWPCIHEFLAVVTRRQALVRPSTPLQAIAQVDGWLSSSGVLVLEETASHWPVLKRTIETSGVTGGAVHDARIAAICIEHGVRELWTADRDFARFPELATFNPFEDDRVHDVKPSYGAVLRARATGRRRALLETR